MTREQQELATENLNLARREAWRYSAALVLSTTWSLWPLRACVRRPTTTIQTAHIRREKHEVQLLRHHRGELLHWVRDRTYAVRLSHKMRERWVKPQAAIQGLY